MASFYIYPNLSFGLKKCFKYECFWHKDKYFNDVSRVYSLKFLDYIRKKYRLTGTYDSEKFPFAELEHYILYEAVINSDLNGVKRIFTIMTRDRIYELCKFWIVTLLFNVCIANVPHFNELNDKKIVFTKDQEEIYRILFEAFLMFGDSKNVVCHVFNSYHYICLRIYICIYLYIYMHLCIYAFIRVYMYIF